MTILDRKNPSIKGQWKRYFRELGAVSVRCCRLFTQGRYTAAKRRRLSRYSKQSAALSARMTVLSYNTRSQKEAQP